MAKVLLVGDYHAHQGELDDCRSLMEFVRETANKNSVDTVFFTGDLFHNHSIVHIDVMKFWHDSFLQLKKEDGFKVIALVGNHDKANDATNQATSLLPYKDLVLLVDKPMVIDGVLYTPYCHDEDEFLGICNRNKETSPHIVMCHQTFLGATYENGFYAKDGFDSEKVPQSTIVSGHIHGGHRFGKVWYPGSPRWRTLSDANQDKRLWLLEIENGNLVSKEPVPTADACTRIWHTTDSIAYPCLETYTGKVTVDVTGDAGYIEKRRKELKAIGYRVRTFLENGNKIHVKESEGVSTAFQKFVDSYRPVYGSDKTKLNELIKERVRL
jgi:predicted phosphodiesterase